MRVSLLFSRLFVTLSFFFQSDRVHVAKSEMPLFQRTIPLYGSRDIWVAWLARAWFFFWPSFYDPSKKQYAHLRHGDVNNEFARDFKFFLSR